MKHRIYLLIFFLACVFSAHAQWTTLNGPFGGQVDDIERDASGNSYALVQQNLYKSTNNGTSWTKLVTTSPTSLFINDLLIANNKFYAIYWNSFYSSTDGLTWTKPATSFPFNSGRKLLKFGPDGFFAVYGNDGIFVTKDEGVTWTKASSDIVYYYGYERVVATTNGDLYATVRKSTNAGYQNFEIKKLTYPGLNGTFDPANWQTKYTPIRTGTITASTSSATVTGVGTLFTTELTVGAAFYNSSGTFIGVVSSIANNTSLTLSGFAAANVSGATFTLYPYHISSQLIASGVNVCLTIDNDILVTQNSGTTWLSAKGNITATNFWGYSGVNSNGAVYYYNGYNNEIYSQINPLPGGTWTITPATAFSNLSTNILCFSFISTSSLMVGTNYAGVFKSTDAGATYSLSTSGLNGGQGKAIEMTATGGKLIYINSTSSKGYWLSTDGGANWSFTTTTYYYSKIKKLADGTILLYGVNGIARSADNLATPVIETGQSTADLVEAADAPGTVFAINNNVIYTSTNSGLTWSPVATTGWPASYFARYIAIDANNIYINTSTGGVYKMLKVARSGGAIADLTNYPGTGTVNGFLVNMFSANSKIYAATSESVYISSDQGANWSTVGFSGNAVFPISDGTNTAICMSKTGSFYVTQDDGLSWNNYTLPITSSYVTSITKDPASTVANPVYYASATLSPAVKFTGKLIADPSTLPAYINFNWQSLNGPYGGVISKIQATADGNTLFAVVGAAGSNGRLWKYSSGAWSQINPVAANGGIYDVEVDASGNVYALPFLNPQKIYKSTDLGVTWNPLTSTNLPATSNSIQKIKVLPNGSILAFGINASLGRIYKSSDNGATFTVQFTSANNVTYGAGSTRIPAATSSGVVAIMGAISEGMIVSTDFGTTWTAKSLSSIIDPVNGFVGSYMYDKDGKLLMQTIFDITAASRVIDIQKSADNGSTWTALPTPNILIPGSASPNPYSKRIIALGTGEYLMCLQTQFDCYRSVDGGATWTNIGNVGDVFIWATTNGTNSYIMGSGNAGILKTTDGGLTFTGFSKGIPHPNASEIALLNNKDLVIGATRPFYSSDFGQTMTLANLEPASKYLQVADSIIGYGGSRRLLKSKDNGKTWAEFGADLLYYTFLTKDATGNGFYGSDGGALKYSTDLINWTNIVLSGLPSNYTITSLVIDQGGVIYAVVFDGVAGVNSVYKVVFGSATKISTNIGTTNPSNILYVNNKIYLYDTQGVIYKSTDGETWTQGSAPAGNSLVVSKDYLFVPAANSVLWLSRNDGVTWQSVGDTPTGSPVPVFRNVVINEYDGYAYATLANSVAKKSGNMVIPDDHTKPVVATFAPVNNATNVSLKPNLTITFDEVTKAVAGKLVRIFDLANQAVPIQTLDMSTAVQNGKSWSIATPTSLSFSKTYFIVVDAGAVTDIFGNAFLGISSSSIWRFTTKNSPTVSAVSPLNAATNVSLTSQFTLTFTEPVLGVAGKKLNVYKTSAPSVSIANVDAAAGVATGNDLKFSLPNGTLAYSTAYFIKFDASSFSTTDGGIFSALTQNTDWTFTSVAAPDIQAPVITYVSDNISKGAGNKIISVSITDNVGVAQSKMFYRSITTSNAVATADLVLNNANGKYEVSIPETAFGPMGLEYYFTASDASANNIRSPLTGNYYSYITFASTNNPQIPTGVLSQGGQLANYRIISVPHALSDNKVSTIFSELGANDNSKWRLLTYKSATAWAQYPGDFTTITQGAGYFINIKTLPTTGLTIEGATTPSFNKETLFSLPLLSGWNQIGNPYTFPIKWSEVLAANSNPTGIGALKVYRGAYQAGDQLDAFEGGFVFNSGPATVTLTVPVVGTLSGGRIAEEKFDIGENQWTVPLLLKTGETENKMPGIGMHPQASTSIDDFDDFNLPRLFDFVEMSFPHPEHFARRLMKDIVPTSLEYTWEFSIESNVIGDCELSWNNAVFGENDKDLFLMDEQKQVLIDMRKASVYRFSASNGRTFKVYFGENLESKISPEKITLGQAFPNPSSGTVVIPFTLPGQNVKYQVQLEVFDGLGRKINTLIQDEFSSGFYQYMWDSSQNLNGLFTYRFVARNQNVQESLSGKIVLKK
jgi:hypothetical protein